MKKAKLTSKEFFDIKKELQLLMTFVPLMNFEQSLEKRGSIWSNDKELKKQNSVKILATKEVIELFD